MDVTTYQLQAMNTEPTAEDYNEARTRMQARAMHHVIGICTEAGELQDQFKRHIFYGKELDETNIKEELGDLTWYIVGLCNTFGFDLEEIMALNNKKLKARFPEKFCGEKAIDRDLDTERKILEGE